MGSWVRLYLQSFSCVTELCGALPALCECESRNPSLSPLVLDYNYNITTVLQIPGKEDVLLKSASSHSPMLKRAKPAKGQESLVAVLPKSKCLCFASLQCPRQ